MTPGDGADLTIFDADNTAAIVVNGRVFTRDRKVTEERPGRLLRAPWQAA